MTTSHDSPSIDPLTKKITSSVEIAASLAHIVAYSDLVDPSSLAESAIPYVLGLPALISLATVRLSTKNFSAKSILKPLSSTKIYFSTPTFNPFPPSFNPFPPQTTLPFEINLPPLAKVPPSLPLSPHETARFPTFTFGSLQTTQAASTSQNNHKP